MNAILEEIACNMTEEFLMYPDVINKICKEDRTLAEKIVDFIKTLIAKIEELYKGYSAKSVEARVLKENIDTFNEALGLWIDAIGRTGNNTQSHSDIKYSLKDNLETQVNEVLDNVNYSNTHVYLGTTPENLIELGLEQRPMLMTSQHVYSIVTDEATAKEQGRYSTKYNYHGMGKEKLISLPDMIANAGMIIKSAYGKDNLNTYVKAALKEDRILVFDKSKSQKLTNIPRVQFPNNILVSDFTNNLTEYRKIVNSIIRKNHTDELNDAPFLAGHSTSINLITSIYGKRDMQRYITQQEKAGNRIYPNEKRSLNKALGVRVQFPGLLTFDKTSFDKIISKTVSDDNRENSEIKLNDAPFLAGHSTRPKTI